MSLLEFKNVSVNYGEVRALVDLSFHVDEGDLISIVGSNGAGKTTTCKTVSGLLPVKSGEIWFDGKDVTKMPSYERVELGIIQCPEGRSLFPLMTVMENLQMGAYCKRGRPYIKENLEKIYEMFPVLASRKNQEARTLSGGEQQMLAIGRALMSMPKILIMDEPSLGLSPINVQIVFDTMDAIRKTGMTVLLVEQNVEKALSASTRGYAIENGKLVLEGTGAELLANEELRRVYLGM